MLVSELSVTLTLRVKGCHIRHGCCLPHHALSNATAFFCLIDGRSYRAPYGSTTRDPGMPRHPSLKQSLGGTYRIAVARDSRIAIHDSRACLKGRAGGGESRSTSRTQKSRQANKIETSIGTQATIDTVVLCSPPWISTGELRQQRAPVPRIGHEQRGVSVRRHQPDPGSPPTASPPNPRILWNRQTPPSRIAD